MSFLLRSSVRRRRDAPSSFDPTQLGVSGWLRNSTESGDVTSWTEVLSGNHGVANAARAPAGLAGGGLDFDTNDCVGWAINATNYNRTALAYVLWVKPDTVATNQTLLSISIGSGGAFARSLVLMYTNTSLMCDVFAAGTAGRRATVNSMAQAGVSRMLTLEYSSEGLGDGNLTLTRDTVVLSPTFSPIGAGAPLGDLVDLGATPGKILIGNFNDGVASNPLNGVIGRNLPCRTSKMSGAGAGQIFTDAARAALFGFEPLT